jgi:hypothetical protein
MRLVCCTLLEGLHFPGIPGLLPHVPIFAHGLQMACILFRHHVPLACFYLLVLFLALVLVEKILPRMPVALGYSTVG